MIQDKDYIPYAIAGPVMNKSVPSTKCPAGSFGDLYGFDGRYTNCLRKFYGMKEVLDTDDVSGIGDIDTYAGPSYIKGIVFQKKGTSDFYRGFVVRWDSQNSVANQQIDLVYTLDNGTTWAKHAIWAAGNSITSTLEVDCVADRGYLFVAVQGKSPKTTYWTGSALTTVDMGPGDFSVELGILTDPATKSADTDYHLRGSGIYQVAWRFYSSARGIYSAMSAPLTIYMDIYKTSKATGTISFNTGGGDGGKMVAGDVITINGRTYEYIDAGSNVTIPVADPDTTAGHCSALANAINGDASAIVSAVAGGTTVSLESKERGSGGNAYTLSETEAGAFADDISVSGATLSGGGSVATTPEEQCKATLDFPANDAVVSGEVYADFAALFDTVEIFRSIDLNSNALSQTGAIFYYEQEIAKTGNWESAGAWDSLQVTLGSMIDEALPFGDAYDPKTDIVTSPPQSGMITRYGELTFMADTQSSSNPYDVLHSSMEQTSGEYFTTYNRHKGLSEDGRSLTAIPAADSMFILNTNSVLHVYKAGKGKPLQYQTLHRGRGLTGKYAASSAGNSVFMVSGSSLMILNATDGNMGQVSATDRLFSLDWADSLADIRSCYDAGLNASFFLNPAEGEMVIMWHSSRLVNMLKGTNFVGCTDCPDIGTGRKTRAFFITATGLIVSPDLEEEGSGTMWGLDSSYTLNGTATSGGNDLVDANATFHADMAGALVYMTSGDNAGLGREINTVNVGTGTLTLVSSFPSQISAGDTYAISPVPCGVRFWPLRDPDNPGDEFQRWVMKSIQISVQKTSGFTDNPNDFWRIGAYRNGGSSLVSGDNSTNTIDMDENPANSVAYLNIDGIKVEPYVEQISAGTMFEMMGISAGVRGTVSREAT